MTRSDNIKEFLKYASPRLEYINHCMEKQALAPETILSAISKLRNRAAKTQDLYPRLKALSESERLKNLAAMKKPKDQLNAVKKVLNERRKNKGLTPLKVNKGWEAPSSKPKPKSNPTKYGDLFDADTVGVDYLAHLKALGRNPSQEARKSYVEAFKKNFLSDSRVVQEAAKRNITPDALFDEVAKHYASGFRGTSGPNARGLRSLFDDATEGKYYNYTSSPIGPITDWFKEHPVATPAIAAGSAALAAGGIGYGAGSSSGYDDAMENAHAYYTLRERFREDALREANSSVASRLANVFGAGDLNALLSGNL